MRKILVLRGGALGDFIVTLPALARLRERWPNADIHLVGNATAASLARARGLLDVVHSQHESRWSALYNPDPLPPALVDWLEEFDLVINYWPDPHGELQKKFPRRSDQQFLSAAAMPARAPAAAHYCEALAPLDLRPSEHFFPLAPLPGVDTPSAGAIVIHPGSGSSRKNWPRPNWLSLIAEIPGPVSLVLGEAETEYWSAVEPPAVTRLERLSLEELVGHFARCRCFLGHDSGISHLAAACGTRCVLLFGPTDPATWAPPSPHVRVIRRGSDLAAISIAEVRASLAEVLAG
jgi:heptosyltransferase-3